MDRITQSRLLEQVQRMFSQSVQLESPEEHYRCFQVRMPEKERHTVALRRTPQTKNSTPRRLTASNPSTLLKRAASQIRD